MKRTTWLLAALAFLCPLPAQADPLSDRDGTTNCIEERARGDLKQVVFTAGVVALATSYVLTVAGYRFIQVFGDDDEAALGFIPVVGPWVNIAAGGPSSGAFAGSLQAASAAVLLTGILLDDSAPCHQPGLPRAGRGAREPTGGGDGADRAPPEGHLEHPGTCTHSSAWRS